MFLLNESDKAPDFSLENADQESRNLDYYRGSWLILYFYPKDNTSGCTLEAQEFSTLEREFSRLGARIVGISPDTCKSHRSFREKHDLTVELLSDPEHQALERYGVWQKKKMYGKEYFGVVRTTFCITPDGTIDRIWPKVKARGHAQQVLEYLKEKA